MKVTKYLFYIISILLFSCKSEDRDLYENADGNFVRFFLQLDTNDNPVEYPAISTKPAMDHYTQNTTNVLKIPVILTAILSKSETVEFSTEIISDELKNYITQGDVVINPSNILHFAPTQLVDTIYIKTKKKLVFTDPSAALKLKLIKCSNPAVSLGTIGQNPKLDVITISFADSQLIDFNFNTDKIALNGVSGEVKNFSLLFSQPILEADYNTLKFFTEKYTGFNYQIKLNTPYKEGLKTLQYSLTSFENFDTNQIVDLTVLTTNTLKGFVSTKINQLSFVKERAFPENSTYDPASEFYNTNDNTFSPQCFFWSNRNPNPWRSFLSFTRPAITNDPKYSNTNGYHRFKLSFYNINNPQNNNNTVLFGLNVIYSNASITSSQFNLLEAIYFYPQSNDNGEIVIPTRVINVVTTSATGGKTYKVKLWGSGTYFRRTDAGNKLGMKVTLFFDESSFGGGTKVQREYYFYAFKSNNSFTTPDKDNNNPIPYLTPTVPGQGSIVLP